ncbi:MAG: hypothetical protein M3Z96_03605 [Pseudomonadota bacterium]|nr:hypothetical protein [Pseudomonadota bacterium]
MGLSQRFGRAGVIDAIADTEYSATLVWHVGEQHWSEPEPPRPRPQGGVTLLDPWIGIEVTGSLGVTLNTPNPATDSSLPSRR